MTKDKEFTDLLKKFDEEAKLFFEKAKRGQKLLDELNEKIVERNATPSKKEGGGDD